MTVDDFIDDKAPQLAKYGKAFLGEQLEFNEVQLYLWDTLEEWQMYQSSGEVQTDLERVFWHLLHAFDRWPEWMLRGNRNLRQHINECCDYLSLGSLGGQPPQGCIGIRP